MNPRRLIYSGGSSSWVWSVSGSRWVINFSEYLLLKRLKRRGLCSSSSSFIHSALLIINSSCFKACERIQVTRPFISSQSSHTCLKTRPTWRTTSHSHRTRRCCTGFFIFVWIWVTVLVQTAEVCVFERRRQWMRRASAGICDCFIVDTFSRNKTNKSDQQAPYTLLGLQSKLEAFHGN